MPFHWTEEDLQRYESRCDPLQKLIEERGFQLKVKKHRNQPVTVDGERYDSKKEYSRYCQLKMLERAGKVSNLRRQVPFVLAPAVVLHGRKKPALRYFADAVYEENGRLVVEDTKSPITREDPVYRMKIHLLKAVHQIEVLET